LSIYKYIFFNCCAGWGYIDLQKFLQCIKNIILELTLSAALVQPPIPGTVSTGIIFAFTFICIHYCHLPPTTILLPLPLGSTCSTLLFSDFIEEKTKDNKTPHFVSLR
jgi:hypothetical protein